MQRLGVPLAEGGAEVTDERIAELRACCTEFVDRVETSDVEECLDEIERLRAELVAGEIIFAALHHHIRRLREALKAGHAMQGSHANCPDCRLLAETEPDRGYIPRNPTPLDPMTLKPPTGGSGVVEPR